MRIAVFGVGGVGGYFGTRLTHSGHDVFFIARGAHLNAIRSNGLIVSSDHGELIGIPKLATDNPAEVGPVDLVVLATKSWQIDAALEAIKPLVGPDTIILPLLNGVEAPAQIDAVFGRGHALGGFCRVLSQVEGPGRIRQGGTTPYVAFGEMDGQESERIRQMRAVFEAAQIRLDTTPDIWVAMWQKFLFIASFSGVGAVTRSSAGVIRMVPQTRELLEAAMREVYDVAIANGVALPDGTVELAMRQFMSLPDSATASMQRDIMQGFPSELEGQNGAVIRFGQRAGIPTPCHSFIYAALLPQETVARQPFTL